jgi:hypothetical protein
MIAQQYPYNCSTQARYLRAARTFLVKACSYCACEVQYMEHTLQHVFHDCKNLQERLQHHLLCITQYDVATSIEL